MKKIFYFIIAALALVAVSCKTIQEDDTIIPAKYQAELALSESELLMYVGETYQLEVAMVQKTKAGAGEEEVYFETSNPKVVIVNNDGLVTAMGAGEATVTASFKDNYSATCHFVVSVELTGVALDQSSVKMEVGGADVQLSLIPTPSDAVIEASAIQWSVEDESIATVQAGKVHAVAGGATTLTATYKGLSASANIIVMSDSYKGLLPHIKNNYFPISWKSDVSALTTVTMEAVIKVDVWEGLSTIFGKEGEWLVRFGDVGYKGGQIQLALSDAAGGNFPSASISPELATGTWYHVAVVWNATNGNRIVYINGEAKCSDKGAKGSVNLTENSYVGYSYDGRYLDGVISELRVWSVERTENQIVANRLSLADNDHEGLIAYWKFDESAGNEIHDYSGNENNIESKFDLKWVNPGEIVFPKRFSLSSEGASANVRVKQNVTSVQWKISADEGVQWTAELTQNPDNLGQIASSGNTITLTIPENNTDDKRVYKVSVKTDAVVEHPELALVVTQTGNVIEAQRVTGTLTEGKYVIMLNYYGHYFYALKTDASQISFGASEDDDNYRNANEGYVTNVQQDIIWNFTKSGDKWIIRPADNPEKAMGVVNTQLGWSNADVPVLADTPVEFTITASDNAWKISNTEGYFLTSSYYGPKFSNSSWDEPAELYKVQ